MKIKFKRFKKENKKEKTVKERIEKPRQKIERTKTGIPGLDDLMNGGIPKGNLVVLSGDPGSGKTVVCFEFLHSGAVQHNEPGIYVSLEEPVEEVVKEALDFEMKFTPLMESGKLEIISVELYDFDKLKSTIEDAIQKMGAKRIAIDPGVVFRLFFEKELDARKRILSLGKMLKKMDCTSIITNEINLDESRSLFGLEEYVADGVILLYHTRTQNKFIRSIAVLKMRGTKISEKLHPVQITGKGLKVLSDQELFEEVEK